MKQRLKDNIFVIIEVSLTIIFYTIVIPFLVIVGLIKANSMIKHFKTRHKYAKINS